VALLFYSEYYDPEDWRRAFRRRDPAFDFRVWPDLGDRSEINSLLAWRPPAGAFGLLPNLKLIYSTGAGVDQLLSEPDRPQGIPIARITDLGQIEGMATYVLGAVLRHHLRFDAYAAQQKRSEWSILKHVRASERRVGVLGLGTLGLPAARAIAARGFDVAGWTRTRRSDVDLRHLAGPDELHELLERSDILVCLLPLTPQTRGILGADLFRRLPRGAALVSVGRGGHLVEPDLLEAIDAGQLSGATLDVFAQEPLPREHPFWRHPRVFVTPHVATLVNPDTAAPQILENLRRLSSGEKLHSIIDEERGY
jgi:glyoxylate/hydroxypyruvate reductase A